MSGAADTHRRREDLFFEILPFGLLVLSAAVSAAILWEEHSTLVAVVALSAAAAAWVAWWMPLHPAWRERPWPMAVFVAGYLGLLAALVSLAPWFGFAVFAAYFYVGRVPRPLQPVVAACTALLVGTAQSGGWPGTEDAASVGIWLALVVVNLVISGALLWFATREEQRKAEREATIAELERLNAELEATLRENAALHAELVERARRAGVEAERQRMAREIHDTLAQSLTGIVTQLEAASGAADWRRHVEAAAKLARQGLTEARRSVHALRPEPLEDARLPDAIADVARSWSELSGVPAQVTTTGEARPMRPEIEVALLRSAQEALANVAKHARASRVGLTLSYMGDVVTLDVRDDGVGFTPGATRNGHAPGGDGGGYGLTAMRERLAALSGTLAVESEPGAGTALSVTMPAVPA